MNKQRILTGQRVTEEKLLASKRLRREMTDAERLLWEALRRNKLAGLPFRRQQIVDGFIVDFYCHKIGLVIELDGGVHESQTARNQDKERDAVLSTRGLQVLRFKNEMVLNDIDTKEVVSS